MNVYSSASTRSVLGLKKNLPQGILLFGHGGIGLLTAATEIAKAHTNEIITIEPDSKGTIGIDTVRDLYTMSRTKGIRTVFIINDADSMGREAQNALLKLLEEPIESVSFILTSHTPERLLETIRSRVLEYGLTPVSPEQSNALLDELKIADATMRAQLLFIAEGLPASLTRYAKTPKLFTERSGTIRDARSFLQGSREDRLIITARYKDRLDALALVSDMQKLLRRSHETALSNGDADKLDSLLNVEAALVENASIRLSLTELSLAL